MLAFDYAMELDFGSSEGEEPLGLQLLNGPVYQNPMSQAKEHAFTLRCLPQELPCQHVIDTRVLLEPPTHLSYQVDSFGNRFCYGMVHEGHSMFRVNVSGHAERYPDRYDPATEQQIMIFRTQSDDTRPGPVLRDLYAQLAERMGLDPTSPEMHPLKNAASEKVTAFAVLARDLIHDYMTYTPDATMYDTTAESAAKGRQGVCQDFSHMMLSLCRMAGIPARYTAGLLLGEGRSHAWVEVAWDGAWHPMDPTNPDIGWDQQIIFSHGRDAIDCKINRGTYYGPAAQMQFVRAQVYNLD